MVNKSILIVDDDQSSRLKLFEALGSDFDVSVAENGQEGLLAVADKQPDVVLTDLKMPILGGLELIKKLRVNYPEVPVVLITGHASVDTAVEAMRLGARDYILKPFDKKAVYDAVINVLSEQKLSTVTKQIAQARRQVSTVKEKPIIGSCEKIVKLMARAKSVASSKATVLISGESGTGKEVFARYIHNVSNRSHGPFIALNCAALPEGLLESELFGHEKGAFTGAISTKKGKFELAHGGTILLDEIGEIPLHLQAKLLRVLQENEVDRLGGKMPIAVDVHVVATTNRDLAEMVTEKTFRQDLFFRLNVIPLYLPALRERGQDIATLAQFFLEKHSKQYNKDIKPFAKTVKRKFMQSPWPGNVREMENIIERAVLLSHTSSYQLPDFWDDLESEEEGVVAEATEWQDVAESKASDNSGVEIVNTSGDFQSLKTVERQMILHALQKTDNNRTHAAKMLGISVRTLRNKLRDYRNQGIIS